MSARPAATAPRSADLRLAALHVRGGSYALARVELETLAGVDALDPDGVLDLAEVRWRTGDLAGADAAAAAWLEEEAADAGPGFVLANAICAEAAVARGDAEAAAARVAAAAPGLADQGALEALLAGIEPRAPWPQPGDASAPIGAAAAPTAAAGATAVADSSAGPADRPAVPADPAAIGAPVGLLWAPPPSGEPAPPRAAAPPVARAHAIPLTPAAASLIASGASLLATEPDRAAVLLALALRADRAAAEEVLAILDAGPTPGVPPDAAPGPPALPSDLPGTPGGATVAFVRGEALRAAGRHEEARIAYASAERLALAPAEAGPSGSPQ